MQSTKGKCAECGQAASIGCCGRRFCTPCFCCSAHGTHTKAHAHGPGVGKQATVLDPERCRREMRDTVAPMWRAVWQETAAEIATEMEKDNRKLAADPLGSIVRAPKRQRRKRAGIGTGGQTRARAEDGGVR